MPSGLNALSHVDEQNAVIARKIDRLAMHET
jgi:hypothetical protein